MSRLRKVKMYRVWLATASVVVLVGQPGQPRGETLDRRLELGVQVDELPEPIGHPGKGDLFLAPPGGEVLDTPVSEVHASTCLAAGAPVRRGVRGHRADETVSRRRRWRRPGPAARPRASWPSPPRARSWPCGTPASARDPRGGAAA